MKKLYEKSEIWFAVLWIIGYCVLSSIGDNMSANVGILKIISLPILIVLTGLLYYFVKRNHLFLKYGLTKPQISASKLLFYIPFIVLITANLWRGIVINYSLLETTIYILASLCVGFLEEMIFRGLLFNAMIKDGIKSAIIVTSITFGIGHIMNLFNGADLLPNILQVIYAIAIGFAFVMIYYKSKSLIPCIITHGLFNATSIFANNVDVTSQERIITSALIAIIAIAYALYIAVILKKEIETNLRTF